jgi:hypothetical protein
MLKFLFERENSLWFILGVLITTDLLSHSYWWVLLLIPIVMIDSYVNRVVMKDEKNA